MSAKTIVVTRKLPDEALVILRNVGELSLWEPDAIIPRPTLLQNVNTADALLCMVTERIDAVAFQV